MKMADPERLNCSTCGKTFSRIDHLKRHIRSHNASRPYKCTRCGKAYARRDVLKRHQQSCEDSLLRPASTQTDKTRRAPEHLLSKFHSSKQPPNKARPKSPALPEPVELPASIEDQLALLTSDEWDADNQLICYPTPPQSNHLGPELFFLDFCGTNGVEMFITQNPATSFSFLVRFTAGLGLKAAYEDPISRIEELFDLDAPHNGYTESDAGSLDFPSLSSSSPQESDQGSSEDSLSGCKTAHIGCVSYSTAMSLLPSYMDANSIIGKCLEIVADLKQARCTLKPANSGDATSIDAVAAQFFSPARLLSFLDYYWSEWHPNLPVIHQPLFVATAAPTHLLAAMAVIGARLSPCTRDQQQGLLLYEVVEQLVFNHLSTVASHAARSRHSQRRSVRALQAAAMVVIFQSKDGEVIDRYRNRRQRMSQMIEAMQLLGVSGARHCDYRSMSIEEFKWLDYTEQEELIRVCNWCFTIDAAFVTFYNIAPRLSLRELKMGLQSTDPCFEATTAQTCLFELQKWQYQTDFDSSLSLYDCIRTFCHAELDVATQIRFAHQNSFTLFCITSSFLIMLFNMDPEIGPLSQYDPLLTAINNWRVTWNRRNILASDAHPDGSMQMGRAKQGYWKHCAEYWLLAYISLQQILNAKSTGSPPSSDALVVRSRCLEYDESSQSKLHSFIQAFSSGMMMV